MSTTPDSLPGYGLACSSETTRSATGRAMGEKVSKRKAKAVRVNGRSGGRPIRLGVLGLRPVPDTEAAAKQGYRLVPPEVASARIRVAWSRSHGGLIFTYPDGHREFWNEGACGSPEEGLQLMWAWFKRTPGVALKLQHREFIWYPFWSGQKTWTYAVQYAQKKKRPT